MNTSKTESLLAFDSGLPSSQRTAGLVAYFGVMFPFLMGLVVLVGWFFHLPQLTMIVPGFSSMQPNTAGGFLLAALSLALLLRETKLRIVFGKILALLVLALGVMTTVEYVFGSDFRIDTLLAAGSLIEPSNPFPRRMSPFTAFCFLTTGVGLFFLTGRRRSTRSISEFGILAAMLTALLGFMGHAYRMRTFYQVGPYNSMAIHTALAFLALGCGILAARPERGLVSLLTRGTSGSLLARRLLPAAFVIPVVLGWLRVNGERAGYFELSTSTALLVISLVVIFVALIWRTAVSLDRNDRARQRTENALRESEAAKAAILASALDCIIAMDSEGRVLDWNPAAEKTFGYPRAEAVGKPLADLIIPARFREAHWRGLSHFLKTGAGPLLGKRIEVSALHANGSEFPVELSIVVSQAEKLFFTAYLRDITERKRSEQAVRESEDRFRTLGENIAQLAWMADEHGEIFWYNRRWYDYTGTTFVEMQGWGWEKVHHPGELQRMLPGWKHALASGEPWEDIFPLRGKDGQYGWFLSRAFPLRDTAGKITRWFGTNTDITELRETQEKLKKAQEELQRHADSLEVAVADRTARLREIIGELEAFSYSLSHDMRAPLRAIQGFTQMALEECGEKAGPFLGRVINAAARLDRMIQEVLSYTRISRQEIRLERLDVDRLVHDIISERPELQPPRAEIIVKTPLLPMWGHEASLIQCLTNLLSNAVKFVPRDVMPRVVVSSELREDAVRIWIEDNGIGIPAEVQPKLFEMFYRINSDKDYEGTGLGLAIVRKAVERMNGAVGVESEPGRGSRFWVELPKGD